MFHGWMFDPDGDQAAAVSTRSSTSFGTCRSVNPRTARRLVTASYTSMIATSYGRSGPRSGAIVVRLAFVYEEKPGSTSAGNPRAVMHVRNGSPSDMPESTIPDG